MLTEELLELVNATVRQKTEGPDARSESSP